LVSGSFIFQFPGAKRFCVNLGIGMKFLWLSLALLFCDGALAQERGVTAAPAGAAADTAKADHVPTGGCMPIGLTARGEMVFPMQCRELLDRERGPAAPDLSAAATPTVPAPAAQQSAAAPDQTVAAAPPRKPTVVRLRRTPRPLTDPIATGSTTARPISRP
jgi:hypothetical protein